MRPQLPRQRPTLPAADTTAADEASPCEGACPSRRAFLRNALGAVVAITGLSALVPFARLSALDVTDTGTVHYPIPAADGTSIDEENQVILCRAHGELFAFALACPHQHTALKALPGAAGFRCPRHKSRYQADGTFIDGRATRNMDRLSITRDGANVVVDPDVAWRSDTQAAQWKAAHVVLTP